MPRRTNRPLTVVSLLLGLFADLYGRKPVMLVGLALFLGGSFLCGHAGSMNTLILFRAIQGLGAGAIQPIAIGWPVSSTLAERMLPRTGYRALIRGGLALTFCAALGLSFLLLPSSCAGAQPVRGAAGGDGRDLPGRGGHRLRGIRGESPVPRDKDRAPGFHHAGVTKSPSWRMARRGFRKFHRNNKRFLYGFATNQTVPIP